MPSRSPPSAKSGVGRADDQRARRFGVAGAELEGHLATVAVAPDHRADQSERRDQRSDVVGDLGIGEDPVRIVGASMPATIRRDHAEAIAHVG